MARRSTPERIDQAREDGIRNWLRDDRRVPNVDALLAAWAVEAATRGIGRLDGAYWDQARPWLAERTR